MSGIADWLLNVPAPAAYLLIALLVLVVVAAIAGDTVGFEVGRRLGPRLLASRPLRRHQRRLARAQEFLRERGGWAVLLGRATAFLRAVMPGLAGSSRMPYPRFLFYNAAGGIVWGVGVTLLGYFAGNTYAIIEKALGRGSAILLVVLVVGGLLGWHRQRRARATALERSPEAEIVAELDAA